jgi:hypothetical protein
MREHRGTTVLVGGQAVYVHTGATTLTVAEYTTDADFSLAPDLLADGPNCSRRSQPAQGRPV